MALVATVSVGCAGKAVYLGNESVDAGTADASASVLTIDAPLKDAAIAINDGNKDICRGILLTPHVVLTAKHCVVAPTATEDAQCRFPAIASIRDLAPVTVRYVSKATSTTELTTVVAFADAGTQSCDDDLILLELAKGADAASFPQTDLGPEPSVGAMVRTYGVGGPQLLDGTVRQSELVAPQNSALPPGYLLTRLPACAGDSGSAVTDKSGRLVGIIAAMNSRVFGAPENCNVDHDTYITSLANHAMLIGKAATLEGHTR